eukprot:COSAG02_NODE_996_length_15338_cov_3.867577_14_plen_124_part_00
MVISIPNPAHRRACIPRISDTRAAAHAFRVSEIPRGSACASRVSQPNAAQLQVLVAAQSTLRRVELEHAASSACTRDAVVARARARARASAIYMRAVLLVVSRPLRARAHGGGAIGAEIDLSL